MAETIERYKQRGFAEGLKRQTVRSRLLNLSALFEYAVNFRKDNGVASAGRRRGLKGPGLRLPGTSKMPEASRR